MNEKDLDVKGAQSYVLKLLSNREYSEKEIRDKLLVNYNVEVVDNLIKCYLEKGFISNERYCEMVVRHYIGSGYGINKIRYQLKQKGISEELICNTLECNNFDWIALAKKQAIQHYGNIEKLSFRDKQKVCAYLVRRGFSISEVFEAVNNEYC